VAVGWLVAAAKGEGASAAEAAAGGTPVGSAAPAVATLVEGFAVPVAEVTPAVDSAVGRAKEARSEGRGTQGCAAVFAAVVTPAAETAALAVEDWAADWAAVAPAAVNLAADLAEGSEAEAPAEAALAAVGERANPVERPGTAAPVGAWGLVEAGSEAEVEGQGLDSEVAARVVGREEVWAPQPQ
jgi:hypothetical protein